MDITLYLCHFDVFIRINYSAEVNVSLVRWFRFFMWKYFKKDPRIETIDDFRFWDNKLFNEYEGETQDENDKYLH